MDGRKMQDITVKQKILSTIVTINDGRLDYLSLANLDKIVTFILQTNDLFKAVDFAKRLDRRVHVEDIIYIVDIINEVLNHE